jgi:hypothetical protein
MNDMGDPYQNRSGTTQRRATILPLDRFSAFSDGVFAIAITILVLEITVPPLSEPLLPALKELWPDFLGYFISFAYIGGIWISHASFILPHEAKRHGCLRPQSTYADLCLSASFYNKIDGHTHFHARCFTGGGHLWP